MAVDTLPFGWVVTRSIHIPWDIREIEMKRTMTVLFAFGLMSTLSVAGCDDTSNTQPEGEDITLDNLEAKFAEAICENLYSCCTPMELADHYSEIGSTRAECITYWQKANEANFNEVKKRVEAGRMKLDGAHASLCLSEVATNCPANFNSPTCEEKSILIGLVLDGDECAGSTECMANSTCAGTSDSMPGTCRPLRKEGEPCTDIACVDGLVCGGASTPQVCIKPKLDGQMCIGDSECVSKYCDIDVCRPMKAIGEACSPQDYQCKDGYCDNVTLVCTPKKATGMPCNPNGNECVGICSFDTKTCADGPPACVGL